MLVGVYVQAQVNQSSHLQVSLSGAGLVLPFQIENGKNNQVSFFPYSPERLQKAAHFVLQQHRDHPLLTMQATNRLWQNLGYTESTILSRDKAEKICQLSRAYFLIVGSAYIHPKKHMYSEGLTLKAKTFFCRSNNLGFTQVAKINSRLQLQSKLRQVLLKVTPFLKLRPLSSVADSPSQRPLDLVAILDFSGSMRTDLGKIIKQFSYLQAQLPVTSRLGLVGIIDKDRIETLNMTTDWLRTLRLWRRKKPRGKISYHGLQKAL